MILLEVGQTLSNLHQIKQSHDLYYLSKNTEKGLTFASFFYLAPGCTNPSSTPRSEALSARLVGSTIHRQVAQKYRLVLSP